MTELPKSKRQGVYMAIHLGYLVQVSLRDTEPGFYARTKACIGWLSVPLRRNMPFRIGHIFLYIYIHLMIK